MTKLVVDGVTIEYEQDDILEAVEILREDGALKAMGSLRQQQAEINEWIKSQKQAEQGKGDGNDPGGSGDPNGGQPSDSGTSGAQPAVPGDGTGTVGNNPSGTPQPPPPLTEGERQEQQPKKRKSRWWGDQLPDSE